MMKWNRDSSALERRLTVTPTLKLKIVSIVRLLRRPNAMIYVIYLLRLVLVVIQMTGSCLPVNSL